MLYSIAAYNYRNLNTQVNLSPGGNLLIASNGTGKTNLLETVNLLASNSTLSPILTWQDLVGPVDSEMSITIKLENWECTLKLSNRKKTYLLNGKATTAAKVQSKIKQITFSPSSVDLVSGSPATRRQDLDQFLVQIYPEYKQNLKNYNLVLRNRNALLKHISNHNGNVTDLDYWTSQLAKYGAVLHAARLDFFSQIDNYITQAGLECYEKPDSQLKASYITKFGKNYEQQILQKYAENVYKEVSVGQTLYGIHKDDYELSLNNKALKYMGSRGEQRLGIFVWKLAKYFMLKSITNEDVILLIDDLSSELDTFHRNKTAQVLLNLGCQFIYTSADIQDVPAILQTSCLAIKL